MDIQHEINQPELEFPFPTGPSGTVPPMFASLRETCPLAPIRTPAGDRALLATRYDDVRQVLADPRFRRDAATPGAPLVYPGDRFRDPQEILNMDPPEHTRLRGLVQGAFTVRQAETWRPVAREIAEGLLDRFVSEGQPGDLVSGYAYHLPIRLLCRVVGVPESDMELVRKCSDAFATRSTLTPEQRAGLLDDLSTYLHGLVTSQAASNRGLAHTLAGLGEEGDRLSIPELVRLARIMISGGYETSANLIARGVYILLTHPDQLDSLRRDAALLPSAVEEILRHQMLGIGGLCRTAVEDVDLPSGTVRAGQAVMPSYVAANHDQRRFPEPERFDLHRPPSQHMHFGHGNHLCLGANLARVELQEAFAAVFDRFPDLQLAIPAADVDWSGGYYSNGPRALPVTW